MHRVFLLALALFAGVLAMRGDGVSVVSAHALLLSAEPVVNAAVQVAPPELTLRFSEPLERKFSSVEVHDQDGRRLDGGLTFDPGDGTVMRVTIGDAGPGYLIVSWETVSVIDGHRINGSYPITILNPDGSAPAAPPPTATTVQGDAAQADLVVAKFILLVAGSVLAGALMFQLWVSPALPGAAGALARRAADHRSGLAAAAALGITAIASLFELGFQASNIDSSLGNVLATRWGERWLLRTACYGVAGLAVAVLWWSKRRESAGWPFAATSLVVTAGAFVAVSSTSHAAAGEGSFWATAIDFVHLLAASVWIGMLLMLALLFRWGQRALQAGQRRPVLAVALQRFSIVAVIGLSLLLFTGALSGVIEVDRAVDLVDSAYGRLLLAKLLLLVPLLAVAAYNAFVLRPAYGASDPTPIDTTLVTDERRFSRMIRVEAAIAVVVLAIVAVLVQINPTRAGSIAAAQPEPFDRTTQVEGIDVRLQVTPNLPGSNTFEVALAGETGFVEQVRLEFFDRSGDISESRLVLDEGAAHTSYTASGPFLSKAGEWQIRVNLRQSQGSDLSVPFDLRVGGDMPERGGAFDSPVRWTLARVLLLAIAGLFLLALVMGSLTGDVQRGGRVGSSIARLRSR